MATRREFLTSGLAAGMVLSLPSAALAARSLKLNRFVLDTRYAETHSAANVMAASGVPVSQFKGDLTEVWYDDLDLAWLAEPQFVGGLTARDGLFVLERLAHDRQMRVVFRADHEPPKHGYISHLANGPGELVRGAASRPSDDWSRSLWAGVMNSGPSGGAQYSRRFLTKDIAVPARSETLISWIMVPRLAAHWSVQTA